MQEFVKAAKAGDTSAWNSLFRQHYPWMYATALHICGNSPAAKDIVQETFVNAYLKLHQLKDINAFGGWLKTILIHYCYRSIHSNLLYTSEDFSSIESSRLQNDEIIKKFDRYEQQTILYYILARLPDTLQSVLLLRYFSDFNSYEQIADILCIPVGTVRSRLNQAKEKMIRHWQQSNANDDKAIL